MLRECTGARKYYSARVALRTVANYYYHRVHGGNRAPRAKLPARFPSRARTHEACVAHRLSIIVGEVFASLVNGMQLVSQCVDSAAASACNSTNGPLFCFVDFIAAQRSFGARIVDRRTPII